MENRKKTKILVTGSAGFMGSHLYDHLAAAGHNVYGVDDLSGGFLRNVSDKKRFTKLDLRDRKKTGDFIARLKPELIYHLAADATEGRSQFTPFSAMDRNWGAYMNLLVPAIKNGLKKMVITSSMSVYGSQKPPFSEDMEPRPEDIYAISKASMEVSTKILSNVHGFRYVIVRPHNVYGPRQNLSDPYRNVLGIFMNRLLRDKYFYIYGDGKQKRAFSYIDDVTAAMAALGFNPKCDGRIFNIGSDHPTTVNDLGTLILKEFFGRSIPRKILPKYLPARPQEVKFAYCTHRELSRLTGYKAKTVLKDGIGEMVTWAKAVGPQKFRYLENLDLINHLTPKTWKNKLL
ncbi:MAG: NAD-dependent epimerase/dehydratase family protein [Parcubacteria group bacterium]|nr:NAD-dependent epimerase/dehydratase family protein [Parcubacteria group bacterium]